MTTISNVVTSVILWAAGKFYPRPRFRKWLELEHLKYKIIQAIAKKESNFPGLLFSYLAIAFSLSERIFINRRWDLVLGLFAIVATKSAKVKELPMLKPHKTKDERDPWDYDERLWHLYSHIIAKNYGWNLKTIANLEIDEAFALIQEIITDEQLDREFLWSMSDRSYIYNVKTKSSKPNPLERPFWMKAEVKPPQMTKIPTAMLPFGVSYDSLPAEFRPKAIH